MTFDEFKNTINLIASADELEGWEFDILLTTLQNVKLNFDAIVGEKVDEGVGKKDAKISE